MRIITPIKLNQEKVKLQELTLRGRIKQALGLPLGANDIKRTFSTPGRTTVSNVIIDPEGYPLTLGQKVGVLRDGEFLLLGVLPVEKRTDGCFECAVDKVQMAS